MCLKGPYARYTFEELLSRVATPGMMDSAPGMIESAEHTDARHRGGRVEGTG